MDTGNTALTTSQLEGSSNGGRTSYLRFSPCSSYGNQRTRLLESSSCWELVDLGLYQVLRGPRRRNPSEGTLSCWRLAIAPEP